MESFLPSQPLSYQQLLWKSLILYRTGFNKIILLSALLSVIIFIPRLMADVIGQDVFVNLQPLSPERLWLMAIDIAALIFFIAILWHMFCVMRNKHEPFIEDFSIGLKKVWYVFIAGIIQSAILFAFGLIVYALLMLLHSMHLLFINSLWGIILTTFVFMGQFILLLYVSTLFVFLIPLIAIENKGILSALEKSIALAWNHWWRVFSLQITPWIGYIVLLIVLKYIINIDIHIYFTHKSHYAIWTSIFNMALFTLFIPWIAALLLIQLKDLEIRKQLAAKSRPKVQK